ncbi:MAG: hypothetical protein O9327_19500, partial [Polaromonas sp.]|nr:hypothetical protein [Polaromonas sp.]
RFKREVNLSHTAAPNLSRGHQGAYRLEFCGLGFGGAATKKRAPAQNCYQNNSIKWTCRMG